jgi:hypothetical protein
LRLPLEVAQLVDAVDRAYSKVSNRAPPEVFLELRAQLTTATPWAPMVNPSRRPGRSSTSPTLNKYDTLKAVKTFSKSLL